MKSWFQPAVAGLWLLLAVSAHAGMREVNTGVVPTLAPDEGLLVVGVDSSRVLDVVQIRRDNKIFGGDSIRNVPPGHTSRLYVATAGDYRWDSIEIYFAGNPFIGFNLADDPEFHFQVKPGVINYPGDLVDRSYGFTTALIHTVNRGLVAIDWLHAHHPAVYERFPLVYNGHYVDPFPDFYKTERTSTASVADADLDKTLPVPDPGTLPIPVKDLWPEQRIVRMDLSPAGDLLAEVTMDSKASHLDLIDLKTHTATPLMTQAAAVERIDWIGNGALAVSYNDSLAPPNVYVVHVGKVGTDGMHAFSNELVPHTGWVVATLPNDNDHLLFQIEARNHELHVFRIDVSGTDALRKFQFPNSDRLDHGVEGAIDWFTDAAGNLRAAVAKNGADWTVFYGAEGRYQPSFKVSEFNPIALSGDGKLFYGLSDKQRGQTDLVSFDPATHAFATIYSKPGVDIHAPVFDAQRRIIGASYFRNGVRVVDYFDEADRNVSVRAAKAFPDATTLLIDRDEAGKHFVLMVERSDHAPGYYDFDPGRSVASLIDDYSADLADRKLAASRIIEVTASDGAKLEAYLTLPPNVAGKVPLVVYPHGGPIGVRDTLEFDPSVQLFASLGYAVLQVNFHGSEGYGRTFREAGQKHFGSLIEDDIDAATRQVLKDAPIDPDRLCIVGASYGGYSALVSAIRWPKRFRCAISLSGVTDQQLMFTASDVSRNKNGRKELETIIGDPVADGARMRTYSPLYRYKELTIPVMLAHGTEDQRVDFEHSRRMLRMLNMAGKPPVMLTLDGEGHGDFNHKNEIALWSGIAGFLRAHLDAQPAVPTSH